jgi:hypothetical protein
VSIKVKFVEALPPHHRSRDESLENLIGKCLYKGIFGVFCFFSSRKEAVSVPH